MFILEQAIVLKSLEIMGEGMLGIFVVLGLIALAIAAISAADRKVQAKKEQKEQQTEENS